jgi:hypothetical protein
MLSAPTDAKTANGISVERAFSWTPEILAFLIAWVGLWCVTFGIVRHYHKDATSILSLGAILISIALVLLGFRFVQRRHRLRVVAFPERNYAEIFSDDHSPQQVPFSSINILIYRMGNTIFYELPMPACLTVLFMLILWMSTPWDFRDLRHCPPNCCDARPCSKPLLYLASDPWLWG